MTQVRVDAWRAMQAHKEQPHVGQFAGYRLHSGRQLGEPTATQQQLQQLLSARLLLAGGKEKAVVRESACRLI